MYAGVEYCEVQSNCVGSSNWTAIAVPVMLGLSALLLLVMVVVRLTNKRVVDRYEFIRLHPAPTPYLWSYLVTKESKPTHN